MERFNRMQQLEMTGQGETDASGRLDASTGADAVDEEEVKTNKKKDAREQFKII